MRRNQGGVRTTRGNRDQQGEEHIRSVAVRAAHDLVEVVHRGGDVVRQQGFRDERLDPLPSAAPAWTAFRSGFSAAVQRVLKFHGALEDVISFEFDFFGRVLSGAALPVPRSRDLPSLACVRTPLGNVVPWLVVARPKRPLPS